MPVEIKELVIRAVVSPPAFGQADPGEPGEDDLDPDAGAFGAGAFGAAASRPAGQDALVAAAVKEVLRILRAAKER